MIVTGQVHHYSLLVANWQQSVNFYVSLFDWQLIERPDLGFPGAWLDTGSFHLHLLELPSTSLKVRPDHSGRDTHLALQVESIEVAMAQLTAKGIAYTASRSGRPAVFFRDLDQNAWELLEIE